MIARNELPAQSAIFTVTVVSDSHEPYFGKGERLTVDPGADLRVEDFVVVESEGVSVLCRVHHAEKGSRCFREVCRKGDGPEIVGSPQGRIVKREAAGSGADGMTWPLPLFEESCGSTKTSLPRFDPELESSPGYGPEPTCPLLFAAGPVNTSVARCAEEEADNESALLRCLHEIERSPMAALMFQSYVIACGAPPNVYSLLLLAARFFRAGELCGLNKAT